MVEFALVLPVLCMVLFGIIQFGILYNNYLTVTDAARVGARKAAVSRQSVNPVQLAEQAARKSAAGLDQSPGPEGFKVFVTAPIWASGADVTVKTTYPYHVKLFGLEVVDGLLESTTTERIE